MSTVTFMHLFGGKLDSYILHLKYIEKKNKVAIMGHRVYLSSCVTIMPEYKSKFRYYRILKSFLSMGFFKFPYSGIWYGLNPYPD